jgi:hypothetical protein
MAISDMAMRQRGHLSIKACALIVSCGFGCGSFSGCMEYSAKVQMPKSVFNERLPIITKRLLDEAAKLQFGFASGSGTSLRYLQFQLESGAINLYGRVNSNTYHSVSISSHEQGSDQVIVIDGYIGDDGLQAAWLFFTKIPRMSIRRVVSNMEEAVKNAASDAP